ncbi:hypothetical protein TIFTF001_029899 [Ficus carica]|uniref:Uncharacterized protein n=1 Tax=Ficus carica TaxID=3494 RepID=A0AA88IYS2_FICCA|nr:hypothetical protein TIFTF001_029899 [Ficus carica]
MDDNEPHERDCRAIVMIEEFVARSSSEIVKHRSRETSRCRLAGGLDDATL